MGDLAIHPYDVAMLVVLGLTGLFGLWKGMAWQVASISSLVLSFVVAGRCSPVVAPYLSKSEPWNHVLAMLILFLATSFAVWTVFRLVAGLIDRVKLKSFDRQIGALFGLLKGGLYCVVITFFAVTLSETLRQQVLQSRSGYYITVAIDKVEPALPEEVHAVIGKYLDTLDRKLEGAPPVETPQVPGFQLGSSGGEERPEESIPQAAPTEPFSGQVGLDRLDRELGRAQEAVRQTGRSLDVLQQRYHRGRDHLDAARGEFYDTLEAIPKRVGDLRSDFERPPPHPR